MVIFHSSARVGAEQAGNSVVSASVLVAGRAAWPFVPEPDEFVADVLVAPPVPGTTSVVGTVQPTASAAKPRAITRTVDFRVKRGIMLIFRRSGISIVSYTHGQGLDATPCRRNTY